MKTRYLARTLGNGCLAGVMIALLSGFSIARADVNVGDTPELRFTADSKEQVNLAELKGKIVIVDFWATWCGPCMAQADHMVELHTKSQPQGVLMIGISLDQDQAQMRQIVKQKNFAWPQYFDGLAWKNKIAVTWGVTSIPQTFIISPDGAVLWRGHPAEMDAELERAVKEHPPQLVDPKVLAGANALLDTVDQSIAAQNYPAAFKALAKVPPEAQADAMLAQRQETARKSLDATAQSMLDEVAKLVDQKEYGKAAAKLKAVASAMAGSPTAKDAMHQLSELRKNPAASAALDAADRAEKADAALQIADKLKADKHDLAAYAKYKAVGKDFPGTPAADTAVAAVKAYDADPAFAKQAAQARTAGDAVKAKGLLSLANNFLSTGNTEKAREKFQELIDKFPTTPQATEAKDALAKLKQ